MEVNERRLAPPADKDAGRFRLSFGLALLVHALMFVSLYSAKPRQIGDPEGADDALSVEIVTEADLGSRAAAASSGGPMLPILDGESAEQQPAPQTAPATAPASPQAAPAPPVPAGTTPSPPKTAAEEKRAAEPQPQARPPAQKDAALKDLVPLSLTEAIDQLNSKSDRPSQVNGKAATDAKSGEGRKPAPAPAKPAANPAIAMKLDLNLPQSAFMRHSFTGGRGGVERPPGVTRSGENDDFARGVVKALQGTMPQLRDTVGRVTVRITLDYRGNIANTQVVSSSGNASLDQSVVFATKQTNYPIPPKNAVAVDLVFLITYVYR